MQLYFVALLALSVGAVMEARCSTPALRPAAPPADRAFRILGRAAFGFWLLLLAWGFWTLPWWHPLSGLIGSLALNALVVGTGGHPYWPGISMALSVIGLVLTGLLFMR